MRAGSRGMSARRPRAAGLGVGGRPRPRGRGSPRRRGRPPSRSGRAGRRGRTAARAHREPVTARPPGTRTGPTAWPPRRRRRPGCARCARGSRCPAPAATPRAACPRTTVDEYSVSPWNSGCGNRTSVNPRFATMVPWVSWSTELPTRTARVIIEFTSRCPNGCSRRPRRVQVQRLPVHGQRAEQDVVRLGQRAPGPVDVAGVQLELLVVQPALLDVPRHRGAPAKPSSRAITMSCTSVVPSPISRILESR